jgi:hypothetical protein
MVCGCLGVRLNRHRVGAAILAALTLFLPFTHAQQARGAAPAASQPRAVAAEFEERLVWRSPENPGFAAWVQLWPEAKPGELGVKFVTRHKPAPGETVEPPPLDVHRYEALSLPANYDFAPLKTDVVMMRSTDGAKTWKETRRTNETELNSASDSGNLSPWRVPDGRLLGVSWGMPGFLRESADDGLHWKPVRELMDGRYYDVAPFICRLLKDNKTLVIYCPYNHSWGPGKLLPGRLYSQPGQRASWTASLIFSEDFGKTFSNPVPIYPGVPVTESEFVELPSGDLLFIHAKLFGGKAHRQLIRKTKLGWIPEPMEDVSDAAPETFVRTDEGYLVGASRNSVYVWSDDDGVSWYPLAGAKTGEYQPRALMLPGNRVLFVWHHGGDLPYGQVDEYIGQHTFKVTVEQPRTRSKLALSRVFDEKAGKYICAFDATLTSEDGKPIANRPIEFSIVGRDQPGYEPFGGAMPWEHGSKKTATTDAKGVARVEYPDQQKVTSIHQTYQIAARFDPDRKDAEYAPATSLMVEYYAVTMTAERN